MRFKQKFNAALFISALGGALALFIVSGCKTPSAKDAAEAGSTQMDSGSEPVVTAPAESSTVTETQQKTATDKVEEKAVEPETVVQKGPGDGAPPVEETNRHLKQMEQSLAPLEVVAAIPPS